MKDRATILPDQLREPLQAQLARAQQLHQSDLEKGYGAVYLPFALERRYPNANKEWGWQYVFPSDRLSPDPRAPGVIRRHHVDESGLQKAVRQAARQAGITKPVVLTPSATPSPPICSSPATTFAPYRNCSAMPTSEPQ